MVVVMGAPVTHSRQLQVGMCKVGWTSLYLVPGHNAHQHVRVTGLVPRLSRKECCAPPPLRTCQGLRTPLSYVPVLLPHPVMHTNALYHLCRSLSAPAPVGALHPPARGGARPADQGRGVLHAHDAGQALICVREQGGAARPAVGAQGGFAIPFFHPTDVCLTCSNGTDGAQQGPCFEARGQRVLEGDFPTRIRSEDTNPHFVGLQPCCNGPFPSYCPSSPVPLPQMLLSLLLSAPLPGALPRQPALPAQRRGRRRPQRQELHHHLQHAAEQPGGGERGVGNVRGERVCVWG